MTSPINKTNRITPPEKKNETNDDDKRQSSRRLSFTSSASESTYTSNSNSDSSATRDLSDVNDSFDRLRKKQTREKKQTNIQIDDEIKKYLKKISDLNSIYNVSKPPLIKKRCKNSCKLSLQKAKKFYPTLEKVHYTDNPIAMARFLSDENKLEIENADIENALTTNNAGGLLALTPKKIKLKFNKFLTPWKLCGDKQLNRYETFLGQNAEPGQYVLIFDLIFNKNDFKQLAFYNSEVGIFVPMNTTGECQMIGEKQVKNADRAREEMNRERLIESLKGLWAGAKSISLLAVYILHKPETE